MINFNEDSIPLIHDFTPNTPQSRIMKSQFDLDVQRFQSQLGKKEEDNFINNWQRKEKKFKDALINQKAEKNPNDPKQPPSVQLMTENVAYLTECSDLDKMFQSGKMLKKRQEKEDKKVQGRSTKRPALA